MTQDFAGKVAFVTGGGSGIGAETARRLAQRGAQVMVSDLDDASAQAVADGITAAGGQAQAQRLDVTDAAALHEAVKQTVATFGGLDLAVNNAGVSQRHFPVAELPQDEWQRLIAINLTGVFNGLQAQIPAMQARGGGSIVNVASIFGTVGSAGRAGYVAAKHGVIGLTRSAALDYAEQGIRVNAIAPGFIDTPLLKQRSAEIGARHPMNRLGTATEIADSVVFLLSDAAGFVTGSVLGADGGYTAR